VVSNAYPITALLALLAVNAQAWQIDRKQSVVSFQVAVIGFLKREGRFTEFSGELTRKDSSFQVSIELQTKSVLMKRGSDAAMLRGPDFFDAEKYPTIRFVSDSTAQKVLEQGGTIAGSLTLRGQQRRESFSMQSVPCRGETAPKSDRACFTVIGSVKRGDYGMSARRAFVSDRVLLEFQLVVDKSDSSSKQDRSRQRKH
jgi:polyisoprenoid-binding protein YceI